MLIGMRHPIVLLAAVSTAFAQIPAPNSSGVAMGHYHVVVRDVEAQKKFWVDVVGAKATKLGSFDVMVFPGALLFIGKGEPSGGSKGTSVNHIGVAVPDVPKFFAEAKAKGARIATPGEAPNAKGADWYFNPAVSANQGFLWAPEDIKLEISEEKELKAPVVNHHIHFYTPDEIATKAWYVKWFGGVPGKRGPFEAADVPGVNLSFSKAAEVVGTKGRSLDHVGFEVRNLEALCKKMEADGVKFTRPYQKIEALGIAVAFFVDPWGTYVELTEGLDKVR